MQGPECTAVAPAHAAKHALRKVRRSLGCHVLLPLPLLLPPLLLLLVLLLPPPLACPGAAQTGSYAVPHWQPVAAQGRGGLGAREKGVHGAHRSVGGPRVCGVWTQTAPPPTHTHKTHV